MRGSYLNDPCRELRTGEPDDEPQATAEALDAAKVYAAPPWLSDVAEALGMVRPSDGAPLALNWTQALAAIRALHMALVTIERSGAPGASIMAKRQDDHACSWCRGMWTPCPVSTARTALAKARNG